MCGNDIVDHNFYSFDKWEEERDGLHITSYKKMIMCNNCFDKFKKYVLGEIVID